MDNNQTQKENAGALPSRKNIPGIKNIIAVASGKGGVGKSTVAVNLALALQLSGKNVGLMDADIYGPSIPMMMGIDKDVQLAVSENGKIIPVEKNGIKLVSIGFLITDDTAVIWRGPLVMSMVKQFLWEVEWGGLDYLIIDLPPGTGDAQLTLIQSVNLKGGIIVTTPQDIALLDVTRGIMMFQKAGINILGIIENMSYFICPHCEKNTNIFSHQGGRRISEKYKIPFLGEIPLEPKIVESGDQGVPIVIKEPQSIQAKIFMDIAQGINAQK